MEEFVRIFEGVADPRRSNVTLRDLDGMPVTGLLSALCGGEGCADMERFGRAEGGFRAVSRAWRTAFRAATPSPTRSMRPTSRGLQRAMLRLAEGRAAGLGGEVVTVDGKALR